MDIQGKVVQLLGLQTGEGKNGPWKKQEFILETTGTYPKKVCMQVWGDKIDQFALSVGAQIQAFIEIESREFNGRWYTDIKVWKVQKADGSVPMAQANDEGSVNLSGPSDDAGLPF